jgi:hypothetical protein
MVKQVIGKPRKKAVKTLRPRPEPNQSQDGILRAATVYLIRKVGALLVATDVRQIRVKELQVWIITVTLRYPTGHEGYVGDLLYDGQTFTLLTPPSVLDHRIRQIATDPERDRKWNELRSSTLPARKG